MSADTGAVSTSNTNDMTLIKRAAELMEGLSPSHRAKMAKFEDGGISTKACNTIRCLAADTVQKAKSGHPGAPMG